MGVNAEVCTVALEDHGSQLWYATVEICGVPVTGLVDTGADITIINGPTFKKIASIVRLKKKYFKKPDKIHNSQTVHVAFFT